MYTRSTGELDLFENRLFCSIVLPAVIFYTALCLGVKLPHEQKDANFINLIAGNCTLFSGVIV